MTRRPAAPANLRNGLKWRDGRPRWEPSPANRACGFAGMDLRLASDGPFMDRGAATTSADARTLWASIVRAAMRDDDAGGVARGQLRRALEALPPMPTDTEAANRRRLVADLIEHGRAVLEDREPDVTRALAGGPRTVQAMVDAFFADAGAMALLAPSTVKAYRVQSGKLIAAFGADRADQVTRPQIRKWYLDLVETISPATANLAIGAAGAFFRWSRWQDPAWRDTNPCTEIGRVAADGRLVFWTVQEEQDFIPWCDANGYADVADCAIVGLWTGARQVDICPLNMPDLEGREVWRFTPQKTQRRKMEALAGLLTPVHERVARRRAALNADPVRHLNAEPFLWDIRNGQRHTSASIGSRFTEARDAAVAAKAVPETFAVKHLQDTRDTCVTRLWAAFTSGGVDTQGKGALERIATWGGWSLKTVGDIIRKHYLTLLDDGAIEAAGQLKLWAVRQGLILSAAA